MLEYPGVRPPDNYCPDVKTCHQLLAVGRWFPPGTPVSSTRKLISSSFHRLDMNLAVTEALTPNKPNKLNPVIAIHKSVISVIVNLIEHNSPFWQHGSIVQSAGRNRGSIIIPVYRGGTDRTRQGDVLLGYLRRNCSNKL